MRCYCSICRKTGGAGGYAINIAAEAKTLEVRGEEHTGVYRALIDRDGERAHSKHARIFCTKCGSHLWAINDRWPDHLHPVASAIDTELPPAPEHVHIMIGSKPTWVPVEGTAADARFDEYPDKSIAAWHDERGLTVE
jgi:hypothetical protein